MQLLLKELRLPSSHSSDAGMMPTQTGADSKFFKHQFWIAMSFRGYVTDFKSIHDTCDFLGGHVRTWDSFAKVLEAPAARCTSTLSGDLNLDSNIVVRNLI